VVLAIVFTVKATLKNVCNDDDDDDIGRITPGHRAAVGTEFLSPYLSHTRRKSCGYSHRISIPTEPQNPTYPYPQPVFSLQEAYFNLLFVTLTVGYYMMYVLCESACD